MYIFYKNENVFAKIDFDFSFVLLKFVEIAKNRNKQKN